MRTRSKYSIIGGVYEGPKVFIGQLDLRFDPVVSLGILEDVRGSLRVDGVGTLKDLGNLRSVGGDLDLMGTSIKSLGRLGAVGGYLDIGKTDVKSLGNLRSLYRDLYLSSDSKIFSLGKLANVSPDTSMYIGDHKENYQELSKKVSTFLKETPLEDYPIHMNHENLIIRNMVMEHLESGVAS